MLHWGRFGNAALEQRFTELAEHIDSELSTDDDDELLLVGHSTGAVMAVSVLARAFALAPELAKNDGHSGPRVVLLTLGQWIPLLGLLPQAHGFRDELARLALSGLDWTDFSAPPDGCCFALTDPYTLCGVAPARAGFPKLLNPRFADMFNADGYRALKRDKFQMHFQYLLAAEKPTEYDYFAITAGRLGLTGRFANAPGVANYRGLTPFRRFD